MNTVDGTRQRLPITGEFHVERHTFVTSLLEARAHPHVAQHLAGHSGPRMTARYTHVGVGEADAAIAAMERRLTVVRGHSLGTGRGARSKNATQRRAASRPRGGG